MQIYFHLYTHNGLGNQLCSFQLLAGLATALPNETIHAIYSTTKRWKIQDPQNYQVDTEPLAEYFDNSNVSLLEMLNYEFPSNVVLHEDDSVIRNRLNSNIIDCQDSFFAPEWVSDEDARNFTVRWHKRVALHPDKNNIFTMTLNWYSKFFMNRTSAMDFEISQIEFLPEYTSLVKRMKADLKEFNGAHVRIMKDHHHIYSFTQDRLISGLGRLDTPERPLLLSVDDWNHPLIQHNSGRYLLAHDFILSNYGDSFKALPHHNRVDLATLSLLLMIESEDFVGTPKSTYTSYIQQQRAQRDVEEWKFFPDPLFDLYKKDAKPYSWFSMGNHANWTWEREWAECKLTYDK